MIATTDDSLRVIMAKASHLRATSLVDEKTVRISAGHRGGVLAAVVDYLADGWLIDRMRNEDSRYGGVVVFGLVRAKKQTAPGQEPSELALTAGRFE